MTLLSLSLSFKKEQELVLILLEFLGIKNVAQKQPQLSS